jgi:hypothetical protein
MAKNAIIGKDVVTAAVHESNSTRRFGSCESIRSSRSLEDFLAGEDNSDEFGHSSSKASPIMKIGACPGGFIRSLQRTKLIVTGALRIIAVSY